MRNADFNRAGMRPLRVHFEIIRVGPQLLLAPTDASGWSIEYLFAPGITKL